MHIEWPAIVLKSLLEFNAAEGNNSVFKLTAAERNTKHQTASSREVPELKHQKPSSKHQRTPKFQAPNHGPRFELGASLVFGVWCLMSGAWDLVVLWSLAFG